MTQTISQNIPHGKINPQHFNVFGAVFLSLLIHAGIFVHFTQEQKIIRLGQDATAKNVQIRVLPAREIITSKPMLTNAVIPKKAQKKVEPKLESVVQSQKLENHSTAGEQTLLASYLEQVRLAVEDQKFYPASARRMRQEGVVEATFILSRSGKLSELISIEGPYEALNQAVRELLQSKATFPVMPAELKQDDVRITLPISFELL